MLPPVRGEGQRGGRVAQAGFSWQKADMPAQYRVLVAQNQQLGVLGQVTSKLHGQQTKHGTDDQINEGEDHPR